MLAIVTMLYITSLGLIYLIARSSYLCPFPAHHHPPLPANTKLFSVFVSPGFVCVWVCVFRVHIELRSYCVCLCLADFTEHNALKIHPHCCSWHHFLIVHGQIIFH